MRAKPERLRGVLAIELEIHAVTGGSAERICVDPGQRIACTLRVVDETFGEAGKPHCGRRDDRALQMRVARQRQWRLRGALEADFGDIATQCLSASRVSSFSHSRVATRIWSLRLRPGVHLAAGIAEALGQARLDRRMTVLVALVEHEFAVAEIFAERIQLTPNARRIRRR